MVEFEGTKYPASTKLDPAEFKADSEADEKRCVATSNTTGLRCRSPFVQDNGWCYQHDPELEETRIEWRVKGGVNSSKLARTEAAILKQPNVSTLAKLIVETMVEVKNGETAPGVGNSVSSLSKALLATMQAASEAERVARLEALIDRVAEQRTVDLGDVLDGEYEVLKVVGD